MLYLPQGGFVDQMYGSKPDEMPLAVAVRLSAGTVRNQTCTLAIVTIIPLPPSFTCIFASVASHSTAPAPTRRPLAESASTFDDLIIATPGNFIFSGPMSCTTRFVSSDETDRLLTDAGYLKVPASEIKPGKDYPAYTADGRMKCFVVSRSRA
jgi:hypothetical protein